MNEQIIDPLKKYFINPAYIIKPDKTRAIITNAKGFDIFYPRGDENTSISWLLNPVYAVIFTFFDGTHTLKDTIARISRELGIVEVKVLSMLKPYINNSKAQMIHYKKEHVDPQFPMLENAFHIPKYFLIENSDNKPRTDLFPKECFYIRRELWDFENFRLSSPICITLMLNNKCVTDCIYCYANKKHVVQNSLTTEKILALIKEANDLGVLIFDISGGEVLLHKDCNVILSELYKNGYTPYVSIKKPLTEKQIIKLKETGLTKIQISIDAWDTSILTKLLGVNKEYFRRLKSTLHFLEKHSIDVSIKSVITRYNCNIDTVKLLLSNLIKFKNISRITIAPGEYSLYKGVKGFLDYRLSMEQWDVLADFVNTFSKDLDIPINVQGITNKIGIIDNVDVKATSFQKRGLCSGNTTSLYILPDGQVTICEELYWSHRFIVGDIKTQSIQEIWESEKALNLYNFSQKDIRNTSACKYCPDFIQCHSKLGVCWKMIYQAYGMESWDLPDPRCPLAPPPENEFYR